MAATPRAAGLGRAALFLVAMVDIHGDDLDELGLWFWLWFGEARRCRNRVYSDGRRRWRVNYLDGRRRAGWYVASDLGARGDDVGLGTAEVEALLDAVGVACGCGKGFH